MKSLIKTSAGRDYKGYLVLNPPTQVETDGMTLPDLTALLREVRWENCQDGCLLGELVRRCREASDLDLKATLRTAVPDVPSAAGDVVLREIARRWERRQG